MSISEIGYYFIKFAGCFQVGCWIAEIMIFLAAKTKRHWRISSVVTPWMKRADGRSHLLWKEKTYSELKNKGIAKPEAIRIVDELLKKANT